jgi:hypothetical protein
MKLAAVALVPTTIFRFSRRGLSVKCLGLFRISQSIDRPFRAARPVMHVKAKTMQAVMAEDLAAA